MEQWIREANQFLESLADVKLDINKRRYAAELAYSNKKNTRMAHWMDEGKNTTYARAKAEVEAEAEFEVLTNAKAEFHYAEDVQKALITKINSMLNINKGVVAHYGSYR